MQREAQQGNPEWETNHKLMDIDGGTTKGTTLSIWEHLKVQDTSKV